MKILVTGANGQLGNELRLLTTSGHNFIFTDVAELDITNEKEVSAFFAAHQPEVVINCAAYTAVDKAEEETELAFRINALAVGNLAKASTAAGAILFHISTDYVFDGKGHRPYTENDPTSPISAYAKSKMQGETEMFRHASSGYILRTSWLYSSFGHNFVKTIMKYGRERGELKVVFDQVGSPTYAHDLGKTILTIINSGRKPGGVELYHFSNEGVASWYDFAKAIVELSGIRCRLNPIPTEEYPLPAVRPYFSVFNKALIKARFGLEIPYWRDSLKHCIAKLENQ